MMISLYFTKNISAIEDIFYFIFVTLRLLLKLYREDMFLWLRQYYIWL